MNSIYYDQKQTTKVFCLRPGMTYEEVKNELAESMQFSKLIIAPRYVRQVGKTQALIEAAKTHGLIIIASHKEMVDLINERAGVKNLAFTPRSITPRRHLAPKGVLIEEGIPIEVIDNLKYHKIVIRGGFLTVDFI